jgi:hypothetical protein
VNATKFLAAIEGSGVAMHLPNVVVMVGGAAAFAPAMYFVGGEELTYTVEIADMSVATCESKDGKIVFSGLQSGTTTAVIKASNGENHSFNITVRKADGWM